MGLICSYWDGYDTPQDSSGLRWINQVLLVFIGTHSDSLALIEAHYSLEVFESHQDSLRPIRDPYAIIGPYMHSSVLSLGGSHSRLTWDS